MFFENMEYDHAMNLLSGAIEAFMPKGVKYKESQVDLLCHVDEVLDVDGVAMNYAVRMTREDFANDEFILDVTVIFDEEGLGIKAYPHNDPDHTDTIENIDFIWHADTEEFSESKVHELLANTLTLWAEEWLA